MLLHFSHFQTDFYLDFYTINGIQSINERTLQTDKQKQKEFSLFYSLHKGQSSEIKVVLAVYLNKFENL